VTGKTAKELLLYNNRLMVMLRKDTEIIKPEQKRS
jgi:hypothetical protein